MRIRVTLRRILLASLAAGPAAACGGAVADGTIESTPDAAAGTDGRAKQDKNNNNDDPGDDTDAGLPDVWHGRRDTGAPDVVLEDAGQCDMDAAPPPSEVCSYYVAAPCSTTTVDTSMCNSLCTGDASSFGCGLATANGQNWIQCYTCGLGRRPEGFDGIGLPPRPGIGTFFAAVSALEAASVGAFRRLRDELEAHGAPHRLVRRAGRSAREEVRHTRTTRALARRRGGSVPSSSPARATRSRRTDRNAVRSLEAVARENAVEGCVRETFGALTAAWQATHATDGAVRGAMLRIADEETSHAELSWEIARWATGRLSRNARARIETAMQDAARELLGEIRRGDEAGVIVSEAGMPSRGDAERMFHAMCRALSIDLA